MRLPVIKSKDQYKRRIVAFGGINRLQGFSEGELFDCSGISHESFPSLTQRRANAPEFLCESPVAAVYGSKECVVTNSAFYYDRKEVGKLSEGDKIIVQIGNKIVIFPDKMYYDTKTEKFLHLDGNCTLTDIKVSFSTNKIALTDVSYITSSTVESIVIKQDKEVFKYSGASIENGKISLSGVKMVPSKNLVAGDIFSEISGTRQYRIAENVSTENGETTILNECIIVETVGKDAFEAFAAGDIVEVSGCEYEVNNKQAKILEVGDNYLLFEENTFESRSENGTVIIKRNIPDFTQVCVFKNRLWGCVGNTLYASALGDPANFFKYSNLSTDSFTVESDSSGDFTATKVYGNYCLFFKEDRCYRLYGDRPANFQLVEAFAGGILKEDSGSIADVDGKILYKGSGGVYMFSGGNPQKVSERLGDIKLTDCVAGSMGDCYYISASAEDGREEFVFDTKHGVWSKSGLKGVKGYFSYAGNLYRLMEDGLYVADEKTDDNCEWYAEFCPFDEDYHKTKNYSRIYVTAQLFENSVIKTEISRDGGEWQTVSLNYGNKKEYINIPCPVKGCHEVRIRLSGKGKSIIESVIREFSVNQR